MQRGALRVIAREVSRNLHSRFNASNANVPFESLRCIGYRQLRAYSPFNMAPPHEERRRIAEDTISRSSLIAETTPKASLSSRFISEQLPALSRDDPSFPNHGRSTIRVVNEDSFTAARNIIALYGSEVTKGKLAVLNLASDEYLAGRWTDVYATTQEEALCYSSTLYATLEESYYPWPNLGPGSVAGVYSPAIVIFKDDLDHDCAELPVEGRRVVSVITIAAPRRPALTGDFAEFAKDNDLEDLRGKIRLVYRMAASNGNEFLILAAMGCGAYRCPPKAVAREMKSILLEEEFEGWFRQVIFAVYSRKGNGPGNFEVFKDAFDGVEL